MKNGKEPLRAASLQRQRQFCVEADQAQCSESLEINIVTKEPYHLNKNAHFPGGGGGRQKAAGWPYQFWKSAVSKLWG